MAYNLTPQGGNADLAGKTVVTLDGYTVTYDSNGFARQSVSPNGDIKYYDALGNETSVPADIRVSPVNDPQAPVLPVSTQMPITDTIPVSSIGSTSTTTSQQANLTAQINSVAQANGQDPNAPLTAEQQAIVDAANNKPVSAPQSPADAANAVANANTNDIPESAIQTTGDTNTGFVYDANGELVPADSAAGEAAIADNAAALDQNIINQANDQPSYYTEEADVVAQQRVQNQMAGESNGYFGTAYDDEGNLNPGWSLDEDNNPVYVGTNTSDGSLFVEPATTAQAASDRAAAEKARLQQTISQQRRAPNNGDWRVKLRLAPQASYLYKSSTPGILKPLQVTDGIIFPYTPAIDTAYKANYSQYDLTHSNYRGYFYQNSYVDAINLRCQFTAQSTSEADYLLATIHFLKSLTKMFYGNDAEAGSPPPLVYLSGLGQYQFNEHPCLLSQFNYSLPADVDYVRAGSNNVNNTNLSLRRPKQTTFAGGLLGGFLGSAVDRLLNAGLPKGGITAPPSPNTISPNNSPTYVPTKMEISISLLPVQSRQQVSKQFSVKQFASGDLLKGGFW